MRTSSIVVDIFNLYLSKNHNFNLSLGSFDTIYVCLTFLADFVIFNEYHLLSTYRMVNVNRQMSTGSNVTGRDCS